MACTGTAVADVPQYKTIAGLDPISDGPYRVVGFGWELINTTPTMYKSGSLLVY